MIQITFIKNGDKHCMTVTGHAGYAEKGKDVVCAGATMLAYTMAQSIAGMAANNQLADDYVLEIASGDAAMSYIPKEEYKALGKHIAWTIMNGAKCLETMYPEYVRVYKIGYAGDCE